MDRILEEIRNEVREKRKDAVLPPFKKVKKQKNFLSEEYNSHLLETGLTQSWSMAYVEMEVPPSPSQLKQKIKDIIAKIVGICVVPVCRKQTFFNLNSTEALYQLYAYANKLEAENRAQEERIKRLEEQMGQIMTEK